MELGSVWEGGLEAAVSAQWWRKALEPIHATSMQVRHGRLETVEGTEHSGFDSKPESANVNQAASLLAQAHLLMIRVM